MCGISGIINMQNQGVNREHILKMNNSIIHRGPDAGDIFLQNNFAFGHRRLSIIDLSDDGNQPMHYLEKYTIIYNGEIYNYVELRSELMDLGYKFVSASDTEVILAAYDMWQDDCVHKFNGMWAFAIWNKEEDKIFMSRDRFGVKPLYYATIDNCFYFSSEIKQILEVTNYRVVNKSILLDFLVIGLLEHKNETFFKGVYKLPASHNLNYNLKDHTFSISKYYQISKNEVYQSYSFDKALEEFTTSLTRAIKWRLRSDVKVGTCLSGGLDSSSIASLGAIENKTKSKDKFIAIHAKSTEKISDESSYAERVVNQHELDLKIVQPSLTDFIESLDEIIYTQEEPFGGPSIVMQYLVMKEARKNKCLVLLDGQGGDETLLGYERYYPSILFNQKSFRGIMNFLFGAKNSRVSLMTIIGYAAYFTIYPLRKMILLNRSRFLKPSYLRLVDFNELKANSKNYLNLFNLQIHELFKTQLPALLRFEDKNSMRNSIETRLPFLDYQLVELSLNLKGSYKIQDGWTKFILRKSIEKFLPAEIVWRKNKFGFEAPKNQWMDFVRTDVSKVMAESIILKELLTESYNIASLNDNQVWKLYNIAKWEKLYKVKL